MQTTSPKRTHHVFYVHSRSLHPHMKCRWFGLGFLFYWCIGTPLLFKSYRLGNARGFWHYTATQHNLWASYYLCLVRLNHYRPANRTCSALHVLVASSSSSFFKHGQPSFVWACSGDGSLQKEMLCELDTRLRCSPALLLARCPVTSSGSESDCPSRHTHTHSFGDKHVLQGVY